MSPKVTIRLIRWIQGHRANVPSVSWPQHTEVTQKTFWKKESTNKEKEKHTTFKVRIFCTGFSTYRFISVTDCFCSGNVQYPLPSLIRFVTGLQREPREVCDLCEKKREKKKEGSNLKFITPSPNTATILMLPQSSSHSKGCPSKERLRTAKSQTWMMKNKRWFSKDKGSQYQNSEVLMQMWGWTPNWRGWGRRLTSSRPSWVTQWEPVREGKEGKRGRAEKKNKERKMTLRLSEVGREYTTKANKAVTIVPVSFRQEDGCGPQGGMWRIWQLPE